MNKLYEKSITRGQQTNKLPMVVWDLGYTLVRLNTKSNNPLMRKKLHFMSCIYGAEKKLSKTEQRALSLLYILGRQKANIIYLPNGTPAPAIIKSWYKGTLSLQAAHKKIKSLLKENRSTNSHEQEFIKELLFSLFDPVLLASNLVIIPSAYKLMQWCNHNNYQQALLSNLDPYTYNEFKHLPAGHKIFQFIPTQRQIISGNIKMVKPHKTIFAHTVKILKQAPEDIIFIDNAHENIESANKLNIHALWLHPGNYKKIKLDLISLSS